MTDLQFLLLVIGPPIAVGIAAIILCIADYIKEKKRIDEICFLYLLR